MPPPSKISRFEHFNIGWRHLLIQGLLVLLAGLLLALASIFNANAIVLFASELSWLPVSGMVIFALGILECFDALFAKESREFHQNIQVGVLDVAVGGLIILSIIETPQRFSMMLAAFLIARGGVRIAMVYALQLPHKISTALAGCCSVILGFMLWQQWPSGAGWFLSLCLNIEIMLRGWAMLMFAWWVRAQGKHRTP